MEKIYVLEFSEEGEYKAYKTLVSAQVAALKSYITYVLPDLVANNVDVNDTVEMVQQDVESLFNSDCIDDYAYIHALPVME